MRHRSQLIAALLTGLCAACAPSTGSATVYRMTIQSHASLGAKCLDVPYEKFFTGMLVRMWDCNNGAAQTFVYDDQTLELKIGSLCVTAWGAGNGNDPIALGACNGGDNQHWRAVAAGDYYQLIGIGNLCFDLRYARKGPRATLQIWTCKEGEPAQLWALIAAQ